VHVVWRGEVVHVCVVHVGVVRWCMLVSVVWRGGVRWWCMLVW
jgi:hypothetical protein